MRPRADLFVSIDPLHPQKAPHILTATLVDGITVI